VGAEVIEAARCDAQLIEDGARATQTIPPRIRRAVLARHNRKCAVPGCEHSAFVDVHHVKPRSEGGKHDPESYAIEDADDLRDPRATAHLCSHRRACEAAASYRCGGLLRLGTASTRVGYTVNRSTQLSTARYDCADPELSSRLVGGDAAPYVWCL
jgi:hypothetical protein